MDLPIYWVMGWIHLFSGVVEWIYLLTGVMGYIYIFTRVVGWVYLFTLQQREGGDSDVSPPVWNFRAVSLIPLL